MHVKNWFEPLPVIQFLFNIFDLSDFSFSHNGCNFPAYRCFQTSLQQTTFENIVTKGEIAHDVRFLILPQCFQLYSIVVLSFIGFRYFCLYVFQIICCRFCCTYEKVWSLKFSAAEVTSIREKRLKLPWYKNHANILTLSHLYTHFDASAADDFWKHRDKRRNCSKRAISSYSTMFST